MTDILKSDEILNSKIILIVIVSTMLIEPFLKKIFFLEKPLIIKNCTVKRLRIVGQKS